MHSSVTPDAHAEGPADGEPSSRAREVSSMRAHSSEEALQHIFADGSRTSAALGFGYRRLWGTLADATDGGKRVRPALFTAAYRSWGGTDTGAAAVVGAAIELLHTAFVVHDDVIDGDDTRHGRLNVSGAHIEQARAGGVETVRAREYGAAAGILAGDLALAAALKAVATCPAPRPIVHELLELFDRALHVTAAGELADVRMSLFPSNPRWTRRSPSRSARRGCTRSGCHCRRARYWRMLPRRPCSRLVTWAGRWESPSNWSTTSSVSSAIRRRPARAR
jgi:hypothetical protein